MIIHLTKDHTPEQESRILARIKEKGFSPDISKGTSVMLIGVLGDTSNAEENDFLELDGVEKVIRVSRPYKLVSREYSAASKVISVGHIPVGAAGLVCMAGPCALENEKQMMKIAEYVARLGIPVLRAGAYKPRTSPYSFQGMGLKGLKILAKAREQFGLKIITEATGLHRHRNEDNVPEEKNVLEYVIEYSDIIQVGARNMKSYGFLQELAILTKDCKKPILLKRGESSTLKDFLLAAEYIVANGNPNVILCLRGIRTFEEEKFQRYTADIGAIAVLKQESNLPLVFDPSHATGYRSSVYAVSMAATAAGADGLIIETHNDPQNALCDGPQCITENQLGRIKHDADAVRALLYPGMAA